MSIDLYPALDAGEIDVAVALERVSTAGRVAPLGAASLLYKNSDEYWPEDAGNDLSSMYPGIEAINLATDGATIGEVFGEQLPQLEDSTERLLVTLTIGGNDLLSAFGNRRPGARPLSKRHDRPDDRVRSIGRTGAHSRRVRRCARAADTRARPAERSHPRAGARDAERIARRRAPAFSRARHVVGGSRARVLGPGARRGVERTRA